MIETGKEKDKTRRVKWKNEVDSDNRNTEVEREGIETESSSNFPLIPNKG